MVLDNYYLLVLCGGKPLHTKITEITYHKSKHIFSGAPIHVDRSVIITTSLLLTKDNKLVSIRNFEWRYLCNGDVLNISHEVESELPLPLALENQLVK